MHPSEILAALVGLKDVRVLAYVRRGRDVELLIEQVPGVVACPACGERAQVKERPVVRYVDLPIYGTPMSLAWKKHRMRCANAACGTQSFVRNDHRIAAKNCLLTTRAAKWATVQVGGGRTVSEVAAELTCDWHMVNDAVVTYGEALLLADRKRLNRTTAIGLDETSFVKLSSRVTTEYATTVADVENHQIIEILPTRLFTDVAGWIDTQPEAWKARIRFGALDMSAAYAAVYSVMLPKAAQVVDPFHVISLANRSLDAVRRRVQTEQTGHRGRPTTPSFGPGGSCCVVRRSSMRERASVCGHSSPSATRTPRWPSPTGSRSASASSTGPVIRMRPRRCSRARDPLPSSHHAPRDPEARSAPSRPGSTRSPTSTWPEYRTVRPRH